jgi:hypothetical protein
MQEKGASAPFFHGENATWLATGNIVPTRFATSRNRRARPREYGLLSRE